VQPVDGFKGEEQAEHLTNPPPEDVLVVYKIHGTFDDGVPPAPGERRPGVVITEEDYITFLTVITTPGAGVPTYVTSQFVGGSLLFLGYSLEDWDFRTLYKGLIEPLLPDERRTSFAIQWRPPKFWAHYWEQKGVVIYDLDIHAFAEELERRYVKRYGRVSAGGARVS
jgi:hypothetical protein